MTHSSLASKEFWIKSWPREQALQHFGVRRHWPPLCEPRATDLLRCICNDGCPRMLVNTAAIIRPDFWKEEVRHACDCVLDGALQRLL